MEWLKDFRKKSGFSRKEMAEKLGISQSLYDKVEFNARLPSQNFMNRFKNTFPTFDMNIFFEKTQHE